MKNSIKKVIILFFLLFGVILNINISEAARSFSYSQTPPAGTEFDMGTTQVLTYRITNTNTGGNANERIFQVRFRINTAYPSRFALGMAAPTGWTVTTNTTTTVTFRANSWNDAIAVNNFVDFPIVINMGITIADISETLLDIRCSYTTTTTGPPFVNLKNITINNPGSWTIRGLSILSIQTTDLSGTPINTLTAGNSFRLVITVKNISSATQSNIVSVPNPPTPTITGTVTLGVGAPVYSPSPLTLAPNAVGTITYTYTTALGNNGTVYFTALVRNNNGTGNTRSRTAQSNVLSVTSSYLNVNVNINVTPSCLFSGDTATFTMTVTNNTGFTINNVTPSPLTRFGTATIGTFTGPVPPSIASIANGATGTFTWTAPVTGVVGATKPYFYVTGYVTYGPPSVTSPTATSNTVDIDGYVININPTTTTASSTNLEISWDIVNKACASVKKVTITPPAGFTVTNDIYSLIERAPSDFVETWAVATSGSPINLVEFTSPSSSDNMALNLSGTFSLVASTPSNVGTYTFDVAITDENDITKTYPTSLTVEPFNSGGKNKIKRKLWYEKFK